MGRPRINRVCEIERGFAMRIERFGGILGAIALLAALASCMTTSSGLDSRNVPSFYLNPPTSKDMLYGVGHAKMATLDLSRSTALARARNDIAAQVSVHVKNALTDYAQQAGEGDKQQTVQYVENVSHQVADVTLSGCRTDKIEVGRDGSVYALVSYDVQRVLDAARSQFMRNESAAFAEFKADEALRRLNAEIQNSPSMR